MQERNRGKRLIAESGPAVSLLSQGFMLWRGRVSTGVRGERKELVKREVYPREVDTCFSKDRTFYKMSGWK